MRAQAEVEVRLGTTLVAVAGDFPEFRASFNDGTTQVVSAIVIATGFEPFDPSDLEEYGYGRYANVVTAPELEWVLNPRGPTRGAPRGLRTASWSTGWPSCSASVPATAGSGRRSVRASVARTAPSRRSPSTNATRKRRSPVSTWTSGPTTGDLRKCTPWPRRKGSATSGAASRDARNSRAGTSWCGPRTLCCRKSSPVPSIWSRCPPACGRAPTSRPWLGSLTSAWPPTVSLPARSGSGTLTTPPGEGVFVAGCASGVKPLRNCIIDGSAAAARVVGLLRARGDHRSAHLEH